MIHFNLNQAEEIQEFQFISDSTGFLLNTKGELYKFRGNNLQLIDTPKDLKITNFQFIDETHGAIIGEKGTLEKIIQKSSFSENGSFLLTIFICILFASKIFKTQKTNYPISKWLFFLLFGCIGVACSNKWQQYKLIDSESPLITYITRYQFTSGFHTYLSNKGLSSHFATTSDGGSNWKMRTVQTNFHLTAISTVGKNYFIGSFANENTSNEIPYHGDGDLFMYGEDSSYCKIIARYNSREKPYYIDLGRGIKGIKNSDIDSTIYVYGSETEPTFPKDENSSTRGNIWVMSMNLKPNYKVIEVPGEAMVLSLSISNNKKIWITTDDKVIDLVDRRCVFKSIGNKKLLCFNNGKWDETTIENCESAKQIEFISSTNTGYVINEKNGELFKTIDGGKTWNSTNIKGIIKMHPYKNQISLLTKNNELKLL